MCLKVVIIDDEENAVLALKSILENNIKDIEIAATLTNPTEAPDVLCTVNPDLVFIDIEMPFINGFEVIESVGNINFEVVFVTAYDQYAINAIKKNALDYILKPIKISEVLQAVTKAKYKIKVKSQNTLETNISIPEIKQNTIKIPTIAGIDFVNTENIIRLEASGNYTNIILENDKQILMSKNIKEAEKTLNEIVFFRTHRSHIINIHQIKRYVLGNGGCIVMSDGTEVPLSRRKKEEFNSIINLSE